MAVIESGESSLIEMMVDRAATTSIQTRIIITAIVSLSGLKPIGATTASVVRVRMNEKNPTYLNRGDLINGQIKRSTVRRVSEKNRTLTMKCRLPKSSVKIPTDMSAMPEAAKTIAPKDDDIVVPSNLHRLKAKGRARRPATMRPVLKAIAPSPTPRSLRYLPPKTYHGL